MWWTKQTLEDLKATRAGKAARLAEIRRLMQSLSSFPGRMLDSSLNLAEEIAKLDVRIEHMERAPRG